GPLQDVFKDLRRHWKEFQDSEPFLHVLQGFINAINWREPWIIAILVFHGILLLTALTTRKRTTLQAIMFASAAGTIYVSERLNRLGGQHWERFATQNYFDPSGVFMSAVVSGPLLLVLLIVLVNYLISCAGMLIQAKKRELLYRAKQRAQAAKKDNAAASSGDKKKD
ncbi:hypothetical protein Agub_g10254, partial [Astrephomene gubernaculifera]